MINCVLIFQEGLSTVDLDSEGPYNQWHLPPTFLQHTHTHTHISRSHRKHPNCNIRIYYFSI